MTMLRLLAMSAALFFASDAIGQVATLDCGSESESMVVRYIADLKPKRPYGLLVDFQSLIRPRTCPARGPCFVTETLSKELLCHKPKGVFKFRFVAVPFNADLQGQCGGRTTGEVTILLNGKQVLPPTEFEDTAACYGAAAEPPAILSITVSSNGTQPLIKRAP